MYFLLFLLFLYAFIRIATRTLTIEGQARYLLFELFMQILSIYVLIYTYIYTYKYLQMHIA